jgi:hypothetical protein
MIEFMVITVVLCAGVALVGGLIHGVIRGVRTYMDITGDKDKSLKFLREREIEKEQMRKRRIENNSSWEKAFKETGWQ